MASDTKKVNLTTTWLDISEGNVSVWIQCLDQARVELRFAPNSAPSVNAVGFELLGGDRQGFAVSAIASGDRLYARSSNTPAALMVMQKAT